MRLHSILVGFLFLGASAWAAEKCDDCHDMFDKHRSHEGAKMGCDGCHAADHKETGFPKHLTGKISDLCFQCHDEKALLDHPVSGHPISGPHDPLYPKEPFSCASCHDPHSADMPHLFRYDYTDGKTPYKGILCATCHWDKVLPKKPPTPPWH